MLWCWWPVWGWRGRYVMCNCKDSWASWAQAAASHPPHWQGWTVSASTDITISPSSLCWLGEVLVWLLSEVERTSVDGMLVPCGGQTVGDTEILTALSSKTSDLLESVQFSQWHNTSHLTPRDSHPHLISSLSDLSTTVQYSSVPLSTVLNLRTKTILKTRKADNWHYTNKNTGQTQSHKINPSLQDFMGILCNKQYSFLL